MLRVACCGHIGMADGLEAAPSSRLSMVDAVVDADAASGGTDGGADSALDGIIRRCACDAGLGECAIRSFNNPLECIQAVAGDKNDACTDLVVCASDIPGMPGLNLVRELRGDGYAGRIIVCTNDDSLAPEAFVLHVDRLLGEPVQADRAEHVLSAVLHYVAKDQAGTLDMRTREGLRRVRLAQVLYVETDGHDQKLHLAGGGSLTVRASSQALFALLEPSGMFFKAGSSFIVNLKAIRLVNAKTSSATLSDGTSIPIPGRVRKALEDAILA